MNTETQQLSRVLENQQLDKVKEKVKSIPVCLITTPSPFLADERVFPFLAPAKIAAELRKNGNRIELLDLSGYANFLDIVGEYVQTTDIRNFGITATSPQIPAAVAIRDTIKKFNPDAKVILGGPHVTLTHGAMTQDQKANRKGRGTEDFNQLTKKFDSLVVGDGERAVFYSIDPDNPAQIIEAGGLESPLFMQKGELEEFEFPARDLLDMDSYHYNIDGHRAFSLIAQLGCPFECGFCGGRDVQAYRIARTRSIESVTIEIENVVRDSITRANETNDPKKILSAVMFYDDELNVSPSNLENLCESLIDLQKRLGMDMRFRGFVKAELFTQKQADLMFKAGFRILLTGVESGSDKILSAMKKHTSREINSRCLTYAHDAGLNVKALMSIGHPGESEGTINESIEWATSNLKLGDEIDWTIITQYPGSPYYDRSVYDSQKDAWLYELQNKNNEPMRLWSKNTDYIKDVYYYKGIPGNYTAYVWTDNLSPEDLVRLRDEAEKKTRSALALSDISLVPQTQFEHSMGQGLSTRILRTSGTIYKG